MNMIMKNIYRIGILCTLALAVSCTGLNKADEDWGTNPHVKKTVPAETRTLTFVIPQYPIGDNGVAPGLKTAWKAGDKIIVHGEYADEQVTVTLEAGDISADKKTATKTVEGLHPYTRDDCHTTLYAAYPAEAVNNLPHCMFYTSFGDTNTQIMAACNREDTFRFQNLSCVVTFVVNGDFDSYTFTGRKDVMLSYELYQVKITDTDVNMKQYMQKPATTITSNAVAADGNTVNYVYIPGDVDLPGGFILRFYKNGEAVKSLTDKEAFAIQRGTGLDLGDVTDLLVDAADDIDPSLATPLDSEGNANCYIVYETGMYRFKALKGNTSVPLEGIKDADILWETCGNGEEVAERSVISGVSYDPESGSVCFQLPNPVKPGNALVAVKDAGGNIIWSWHIWIPETQISVSTFGYTSGCSMMSRNLGALVDTQPGAIADARSFGLLYQWGRKDPFIGVKEAGSTERAAFAGVAMTVHDGQMTQEEAIAQPTVLACVPIDGDNKTDWCSQVDIMYWGDQEKSGTKTIYDPCPPGYRAPGRKRATIFTAEGSTLAGWLYDAENYYFQVGSPVSTLPITGYMNCDGTYTPGVSVIWNTHMDADTPHISYCELVKDGVSKKGQMARALGGSVRCETDE